MDSIACFVPKPFFCDLVIYLFPYFDDEGRKGEGRETGREEGEGMILVAIMKWMGCWYRIGIACLL